jgi:polyphosphate kinase 2 (PPK2 family)
MVIKVKEKNESKGWAPQVKPFKLPTRWPKGQTVLDRLYWCYAAQGQTVVFSRGWYRVDSLMSQAFGLL